MLEVWRKALDGKNKAGGILTDLSKGFDCLNHKLSIAKLASYGFDNTALNLMYDYLKKRKQRTKVNGSYISWRELKFEFRKDLFLDLFYSIFL